MYNSSFHFTCPSCGDRALSVSVSVPTYVPVRNINIECPNPSCGGNWDIKWEITNYIPPLDPSAGDPSLG